MALASPMDVGVLVHREVLRLPRVEGRADLRLWRALAPERLIFGQKRSHPILLRADDAVSADVLEDLGVDVVPGRWVSIQADGGLLMELMSAEGDIRLESAPSHRPLLKDTLQEVGALGVHHGSHEQLGYRGMGVLVGIIDTGIDLSHSTFLDDAGRSRVVAFWDQDGVASSGPDGFDYGHLCDERAIQSSTCTLVDPLGHGTHVAGIAAGLNGVAPAADIAVVRSDSFTRVADAVLFLKELADDRGQPLVVNLSVGGHYGAHDGRTALEEYLEQVVGPGVILVAAAGNDGARSIHVGHDFSDETKRFGFTGIPWSKPSEVSVELWSAHSGDVKLALELWEDGHRKSSLSLSSSGDDYMEARLTHNHIRVADITYGVEMADHGMVKRTLLIDPDICPRGGTTAQVVVVVEGSGRVDGWITQSDHRYGLSTFDKVEKAGWLTGNSQRSITVPATGKALITVGSYSVRQKWRSSDDQEHQAGQAEMGSLSSFSSRGPVLVDGAEIIKPDIVAPGSMIISARALSVPPSIQTINSEHMIMQGTSMAAPHVTGIVALMLEVNPELTPEDVRDRLAQSARTDEHTGSFPSNEWGFGKVDAAASVSLVEVLSVGCASSRTQDQGAFLTMLCFLLGLGRRKKRCV
jgi:subtilisin family serine protease